MEEENGTVFRNFFFQGNIERICVCVERERANI